jgi:two-component system, chemotaxis family, sensor kinase Cph1
VTAVNAPASLELLASGSIVNFDNCAREAIHRPGAVQPHGVLFVARVGDGVIVQASTNASALLGPVAASPLDRPLPDVIGSGPAASLLDLCPDDDSPCQSATTVIEDREFDALVYCPAPGFRVVELEPARGDDGDGNGDPAGPADIRRLLEQLRATESLDDLLGRAVRIMRDVTGHERVWAYRFAPDGHGVIVAEAKSDRLGSFLGLHYPEGDIPAQARALYLRTGVRTIVDSHAEPAGLVSSGSDTDPWVDMSDGALRAVSPMHIAYLRQMGVRASMSVALVVDGRLWGLLSAHHYDEPRRLGRRARATVEMLGLLVGMQLDGFERADLASGLLSLQQYQNRVLEQVATARGVPEGLVADADALLGVCRASGAIVRVGDEIFLVGETPPKARCAELLRGLHARNDTGDVLSLDCVSDEHAEFADIAGTAAGALWAPLSRRHANVVVWLRPEHVSEVTWGNPVASVTVGPDGDERLTPRGSFERWTETVRLRCRPWLPEELAAARQLHGALGTLLLGQAEALARANSELVRANAELDAFAYSAAHDLREPLRGVSTLANFMVEDYHDVLDDVGRDRMSRLVSQAQRMARLLDSLLDYATLGRAEMSLQEVSVASVAAEAGEVLRSRFDDRHGELRHGPDAKVRADPVQLLEVLTNLVANGLKYNDDPHPLVEVGVMALSATALGHESPAIKRSAFADRPEPPVVYVSDNGIGIAPEDREEAFRVFRRLHSQDEYGAGSGAGLAIVRRIVERHGGSVWIEDGDAGGCRVCFTVEP